MIRNVSDTARWVAWYRAEESDRPDALFHDPYARRLAGDRGAEIIRTLPGAGNLGWVMVVRTCLFDELILRLVGAGDVDTVVNLAAGFDTRPYRLALPADLRWIDVDLPPLLEEKQALLAGEQPRCRLESVPLDLADQDARVRFLARVAASSRSALVLSEGLLAYLAPEAVRELATALHEQPAFTSWILDLASPFILQQVMKRANRQLREGNAEMRFAPEEGEEFFRPSGWECVEFRLTGSEAHRLGREMRLAWLFRLLMRLTPTARRARIEKRYRAGVVLLKRI